VPALTAPCAKHSGKHRIRIAHLENRREDNVGALARVPSAGALMQNADLLRNRSVRPTELETGSTDSAP
jgi:hypothetical protein